MAYFTINWRWITLTYFWSFQWKCFSWKYQWTLFTACTIHTISAKVTFTAWFTHTIRSLTFDHFTHSCTEWLSSWTIQMSSARNFFSFSTAFSSFTFWSFAFWTFSLWTFFISLFIQCRFLTFTTFFWSFFRSFLWAFLWSL